MKLVNTKIDIFLAKIDVNQDSLSCAIIQSLSFLNHELKNKIKNKILYHN